ncbi:OLC1v1024946C1 [Oldenlandia corymbosa var. corymbosa]|uniref:OLC1v1024946C1 n=1 Tax=Oldenlandia corymbosa var. corymbosa TaxID=529605 RepID=A0AAV1C3Q6_OLDCO|nr:OLC1v1024946C1 [Oldenlandia corymbosa var. corymbosa]
MASRIPRLIQRFPIPDASGPESIAFDPTGGGPYTGVFDGRILRWDPIQSRWITFAVTTPIRTSCEGSHDHTLTESKCGRPLGLDFNKRTGELYIADAYRGLLVVGPKGGVATQLATLAQGHPFRLTNDVVVDQTNGLVYFTDSSIKYPRKDYGSILSTRDNTGRLLVYDPITRAVTVLANGLMFPNGVALSQRGDFILVTETTNGRVLRYWLRPAPGKSAGTIELFAQLPGNPDNIRKNQNGDFWVAMNSRGVPNFTGLGMIARLDQNGKIVVVPQDPTGAMWRHASHVHEDRGSLWIGSVVESAIVRLRI